MVWFSRFDPPGSGRRTGAQRFASRKHSDDAAGNDEFRSVREGGVRPASWVL